MIKYLLILVNSFGLFIFGLFTGDSDVKVTGNIPAELVAGKEVAIEIKIAKNDIVGFGRFQIELPEGITVKDAEEKEAEYTFEENKAKWIWASLPEGNEITLKFTLVASLSAIGDREINARFSYVENNEKAFTDMAPAKVKVVAAEGAVTAEQAPAPAVATETQQPATTSNAEPPGDIVVMRSIKKSESGNGVIVNIKIKKGNTKGFARYSDDAYANLTAKAVKTDGSSFSIADGKLKFVWVNVPEKDELEISYTLNGSPASPITVNGEYSYLEDNQSKKVQLQPETIDFNTTATSTEPLAGKGNGETQGGGEAPKLGGSESRNDGKATFEVQVGAFTNSKVTTTTLKRKFNINEAIRSEMQGGFSKFMVGSHREYKKAREHRENTVTVNGVKSAFVVAYNDGKRITVQEALMITNQRWFK